MAATYTAKINAVDRAETHVLLDGFKINEVTNGINTLVCRVASEDASYRPLKRQTIEIEEDDGTSPVRLIFGGTLRMVREHGWGMTADGDDAIILELSADSYKTLASRRFVTETIPAGTLKAALQVLEPYLTAYGVTLDPAQANGPTLEAIEFKVVRVDDCLNFLATLTAKYGAPFIWTIGYDKVLGMYQTGTAAAPWNLIESEFITLESSTGDIEVEPTDDNYANKIILIWGNGNVIDLGPDGLNTPEQFVGNGVTNSFPLKYLLLGPIPGNNIGAIGYGYVNVPGPAIAPLGSIGTANMEWEYDPVTNSVSRVAGAPALGFAFSVPYRGELRGEAIALDAGEITANGLWEDKILATEIEDPVLAQSMAEAELARRIATGRIVRFMTRRMPAPVPGDSLTITVPKRNISGTFNVTDVATENDPGNVNALIRTVTCNSSIHEQYHQTLTRWWSEKDTTGIAAPAGASAVPAPPLYSVQWNDQWKFGGAYHVLYYDLSMSFPDLFLSPPEVKSKGLLFVQNQDLGAGGHIGITDPQRLEMGMIGEGDFSMDLLGIDASLLMNAGGDISITAGSILGVTGDGGSPGIFGSVLLTGNQSIVDDLATLSGVQPGVQTIPGNVGDSFSRFNQLNVIEGLAGLYQTIASLPYTVNTTAPSNTREFLAFINTAGTGTVFIPYHADAGSPDYRIFPVTAVGRMFWFYNESGTMTLDAGTDGSNINGDASITLDAEQSVLLMRHDTGYKILSSHGFGTGSGSPGAGGTPGGPVNAVQYHNPSGDFDGEAAFTYDEAINQLTLTTDTATNYSTLRVIDTDGLDAVVAISSFSSSGYSDVTFGRERVNGVDTARTYAPAYLWFQNAGGSGVSPGNDSIGLEINPGEDPGSPMAFAVGRGLNIDASGLAEVYQYGGLGTGAFPGCGLEIYRNDDGNGAAGFLCLQDKGGDRHYLWVDDSGVPRIGSAPPQEDGTPSDTSGTVLGGSPTTLTALTADPGAPTNGDVWVRASGTTPTRLLELRIRDGGVSHTIAGITV